jgi:LysR family transcriptional regulator, transcriptional activator of nhaA
MDWLNYHHLLYFWTVAREGSIAKACRQLRLTQPTISAQIRVLEDRLGEKLFLRSGRNLVMSEVGKVVYRYADEIFTLGRELTDTLKGRPTGRPVRLLVGITDAMPKLIVHRLLEPALMLPEKVLLICRENRPQQLMVELATHTLDVVLSDAPVGPEANVRAFNHLLGECDVTVYGAASIAGRYRNGFPGSLDGAPFLLPGEGSALRRTLEHWFESAGIRPDVVGEIQDSALLKVFGGAGLGLFASATVIDEQVRRQFGVRPVGRLEQVRERFYVITVERRLKNPAVVAISDAAREKLFN